MSSTTYVQKCDECGVEIWMLSYWYAGRRLCAICYAKAPKINLWEVSEE